LIEQFKQRMRKLDSDITIKEVLEDDRDIVWRVFLRL